MTETKIIVGVYSQACFGISETIITVGAYSQIDFRHSESTFSTELGSHEFHSALS